MLKIVSVDSKNIDTVISKLENRENSYKKIDEKVEVIINEVIKNGDSALKKYTLLFDGADISEFKVSQQEIDSAYSQVEEKFISIIKQAKENIEDFHKKQLTKSWFTNSNNGLILGQMINPIEKVGIYVPGGKAAYPSTVLMNAVPAKVAGVSSIVMATPPDKNGNINPYILAAAKIAGVNQIYKLGGAQAIAAMAYGTESVKKVDKITGPGNIYVARAKKMVFGTVDIDMIAGPSEICIIADENSNPKYIAADLFSQAEHDEMAAVSLITTSKSLSDEVVKFLHSDIENLSRKSIISKSLENFGSIYLTDNLETAFNICNNLAPEHLEIMLSDPFSYISKIKNAGAVFLGSYSPEPLGDYFAGPNHTLPTGGSAKFSSPLGVEDFIKKSSIIYYSKEELDKVNKDIQYFAEKEGLDAHANSLKVRL
ncbi:MAG: histidinol dehydrogenase [Bacillota bacterium]|nr:histidinol dehydrogenase [Bacillota bacterium]